MLSYRTPGAYFDWLDERRPIVQPLRTDVAGFVGIAVRGPLHHAVKVESWPQFTATFGSFTPQGFLAYAVEGFFANGGRTCWVVRVADPEKAIPASLTLVDRYCVPTLRFEATSPGTWGNSLGLKVIRTANSITLTVLGPAGVRETWRNLRLDNIEQMLNDELSGSRFIRVKNLHSYMLETDTLPTRPLPTPDPDGNGNNEQDDCEQAPPPEPWLFCGGTDGLGTLKPHHLSGYDLPAGTDIDAKYGLRVLADEDSVNIVAMPDIMSKTHREVAHVKPFPQDCDDLEDRPLPPDLYVAPSVEYPPDFDEDTTRCLQDSLVRHCEELQDRFAILDPASQQRRAPAEDIATLQSNRNLDAIKSTYAALYYPWLLVPDHLGLPGELLEVPPSGHVAGVYARTDIERGVHKPPANARLEGARDVTIRIDEIGHGDLNEANVNLIRPFAGRGLRVVGARTRSFEPEWRYVNVRRLMTMVREAIDEQTQWTVFEPNSPDLWRDIDRALRNFLGGLWQGGQLDGATANDAFYVICDETTNPPEETGAGRLTAEIGLRPPWPAEFVVVRIRKTDGVTEVLEMTGGGRDA